MDELRTAVDSNVYQSLIEGSVDSLFIILHRSLNELCELTHLPIETLEIIKNKATDIVFKQKIMTADTVPPWDRISTGCSNIDTLIRGGIPINGITEIYGCSGVGKTQFCLQLSLMVQLPAIFDGKAKGAVYICTEDVFPSKRFNQLASNFKNKYNLHHLDFESNVYLQHTADYEQLRRCLTIRLPQLLRVKNIGLLVIDSIAGIFRSETNISYNSRSQDIGVIGSALHSLWNEYKLGVICVNQVSDNLLTEKSEPCLGLAWSNNVTCRFCITRHNNSGTRNFKVIFAPDLPNSECDFTVNEDGLS